MGMNGNTLGDAIKTAVDAVGVAAGTEITGAQRTSIFRAIGAQVVTHIQSNATVTTATPGAQSGGSTLPGTGTVA